MRFILASQSSARLNTLRQAGIDPEVVVSSVDESGFRADQPADLTRQLAVAKAEAVFDRLGRPEDAIIIGCDSLFELDGQAIGKPGSAEAAAALLRRTRGRRGLLHTGHHLIVSANPDLPVAASTDPTVDDNITITSHSHEPDTSPRRVTAVASSQVQVGPMTDDEVAAYVATGEPQAVAGGFTIDGLGGPFIESIIGDHHNVVGLSLPLLRQMLRAAGISWPRLWRRL
ncbi:MAG: Maf family protein [Propionibacteriaceae bacterium]|jgi:septum formation protein|nr:Maf family protein [Propionibacteriaceae bacterium]